VVAPAAGPVAAARAGLAETALVARPWDDV
jgi:hypothetical protein